jgi:signal transduction histidine kinase
MIALPPDVKIVFYRIAQEALNNIVKHSRAQRVQIGMYHEDGQIILRIDDDGRGFVTGTIPSNRLGVNIMRERAETIQAKFNITSRLGHGTQITVAWSSTKAVVVA